MPFPWDDDDLLLRPLNARNRHVPYPLNQSSRTGGFFYPLERARRPLSLMEEHLESLARQASLLKQAVNHFYSYDTASVAAKLQLQRVGSAMWSMAFPGWATTVLGSVAFMLGEGVGLAESLWDQLKGLYTLPRPTALCWISKPRR